MQPSELHYHHPTMAWSWGVMQEIVEEAMAPQDEEWDCPPWTPQTLPHQMEIQTLREGFQKTFGEEEGNKNSKKKKTKTRQSNSLRPCTTN
jgi:hypothetical protein